MWQKETSLEELRRRSTTALEDRLSKEQKAVCPANFRGVSPGEWIPRSHGKAHDVFKRQRFCSCLCYLRCIYRSQESTMQW